MAEACQNHSCNEDRIGLTSMEVLRRSGIVDKQGRNMASQLLVSDGRERCVSPKFQQKPVDGTLNKSSIPVKPRELGQEARQRKASVNSWVLSLRSDVDSAITCTFH